MFYQALIIVCNMAQNSHGDPLFESVDDDDDDDFLVNDDEYPYRNLANEEDHNATLTQQNLTVMADEASTSSSSSGKISSLSFADGLLIIGGSLLATFILMMVIRLNTSSYEHRATHLALPSSGMIGDDRLQDESDCEEQHTEATPQGILRPRLMSLQGKTRSHEGAEFVKLNHYEGGEGMRSPTQTKHQRIQSV
jgi:hypothetical protein